LNKKYFKNKLKPHFQTILNIIISKIILKNKKIYYFNTILNKNILKIIIITLPNNY
jgi:hypothetical protein